MATGEVVFRQGDHHEGIHAILSGAVRVFLAAPSGRETLVEAVVDEGRCSSAVIRMLGTLERFRAQGLAEVRRHRLLLRDERALRELADDAWEGTR